MKANGIKPGTGGLKPITGPDICRLREAHGWRLERIKASHHIYSKCQQDRARCCDQW